MEQREETTPDQLLDIFQSRSLTKLITFTIVVHVVLLLATSMPFIWKSVAGRDTSSLSEEERVKVAVGEATSSLRKIAEAHGLSVQDLSSQFAGGPSPASQPQEVPKATDPTEPPKTEGDKPAPYGGQPAPDKPASEIEKEIGKVKEGPAVPPVDEEEDLFK